MLYILIFARVRAQDPFLYKSVFHFCRQTLCTRPCTQYLIFCHKHVFCARPRTKLIFGIRADTRRILSYFVFDRILCAHALKKTHLILARVRAQNPFSRILFFCYILCASAHKTYSGNLILACAHARAQYCANIREIMCITKYENHPGKY